MHPPTAQVHTGGSTQLALRAETFRRFQELLHARVGVFLTPNKAQLLISRLGRRLRERACPDLESYYELVTSAAGHEAEFQEMVNRITTNKTDFFREPHHFVSLANHLRRIASAHPDRPIRVWSAGCSTGEEPYTIAMVLRETLSPEAFARAEVFASDIDTEVLHAAERGVYEQRRLDPVPSARWRPLFLRGTGAETGRVRVGPELRDRVRFGQVNLVESDWVTDEAFDAVFCRNTLIYFDRPTQTGIVDRLVRCVRPGGLLFLGHSENLLGDVPSLTSVGTTTYERVSAGRPTKSTSSAGSLPARPITSRVTAGGMFCSARPAIVRTLLGSCVAACLYDPVSRIGGMNHFLLPRGHSRGAGRALAYGVHAMEVLINEIMRRGGDRRRLEAKVFGAASVLKDFQGGRDVARRNAEFVRRYLADEGIPIVGHKLGGEHPIEVQFQTHTGRAFARSAGRARLPATAATDAAYFEQVTQTVRVTDGGDATLFEDSDE